MMYGLNPHFPPLSIASITKAPQRWMPKIMTGPGAGSRSPFCAEKGNRLNRGWNRWKSHEIPLSEHGFPYGTNRHGCFLFWKYGTSPVKMGNPWKSPRQMEENVAEKKCGKDGAIHYRYVYRNGGFFQLAWACHVWLPGGMGWIIWFEYLESGDNIWIHMVTYQNSHGSKVFNGTMKTPILTTSFQHQYSGPFRFFCRRFSAKK